MARLSSWLPLILLFAEQIQERKAKKVLGALPLVQAVRSRFRLAYLNGAGFELSKEEVQQIGVYLKLD